MDARDYGKLGGRPNKGKVVRAAARRASPRAARG
jgi:hypothetical protein